MALSALHGETEQSPASRLLALVANFGGSGESEDHRRLKTFIAAHPRAVGLDPRVGAGSIEHRLPSGDTIDVLFRDGPAWIAVEAKSLVSNTLDIARGLFQCVKYRAVIDAVQTISGLPRDARAILAVEGSLPADLNLIKSTLGIDVVEKVRGYDG
jgi:hypothetical protein